MVSNGGILDCSEHGGGGRVFFDGHHHIYIRDSRYIYIGPMTAVDCQIYLLCVNEVVIEGGSFNAISNRTRPAITLQVSVEPCTLLQEVSLLLLQIISFLIQQH